MAGKKSKQNKTVQRTVVLLLILTVAQTGFLAYQWSKNDVMSVPEAIKDAVSQVDDPVEKSRHALRLAVMQYRIRYQSLPLEFEQLVPDFIDKVPRNPKTGAEFKLVYSDKNFRIALDDAEARRIKASMNGASVAGEFFSDDELIDVGEIDTSYNYDPSGKRDPFLPQGSELEFEGSCEEPILCTSIVKLKLALVIDTGRGKRAMVETPDGRGYTVVVGSKIGNANGEVVEITDDKVIILEQKKDLAGNLREQTRELSLRTKDDDKKGERRARGSRR